MYFSGKTGEQKELIDFITELLKEYLIKENLIDEQDEEDNNEGIILDKKMNIAKRKKVIVQNKIYYLYIFNDI